MTLHERIQAARLAQQLHQQRHDVQLEIDPFNDAREKWAYGSGRGSLSTGWEDMEDDVDPSQISSGLMWDFPDTSYHVDATKEDRA